MSKKMKIASIMLYTASILTMILGLIYSITWKLLPYHEKFLGKTLEQLDPKVGIALIQSTRVMGAGALAVGTILLILTKGPFARNENWTGWAILVMMMIFLLPLLKVTLTIGLSSPWWLVVIMIILTVSAFFLSKSESSMSKL